MDGVSATSEIYQLHILLLEISLAIWRRFRVRNDSTLTDLRYTIQIAFDGPTCATTVSACSTLTTASIGPTGRGIRRTRAR